MPTGRFAPSPSGRLHLGNLRTALFAWLFARSDESAFFLRFEDLGPRDLVHYQTQQEDLAALGLDFDGEPTTQLKRLDIYRDVVSDLTRQGLVYECFCSRREIREAAEAPNGAFTGHSYPGTCRQLSRQQREQKIATGRKPALRVRANDVQKGFSDRLAGDQLFDVDDFVIQRNDGIPAYHLVVVVDDHEQGIELVVRADDLLASTSRQLVLHELLKIEPPDYAHVPLVLAPDGERLAKRHGAVSLEDQRRAGQLPPQVLAYLASTAGLCSPTEDVTPKMLLERFDPDNLPTQPLLLSEEVLEAQ